MLLVVGWLAVGIVTGEASGAVEDRQAAVRVFMHPHARLDVVMAVAVGGYWSSPREVVHPYS